MLLAHGRGLSGDAGQFCTSAGARREFGQSKIENLGVAAPGHENVCRLDVAMDDSLRVGRIQRIRYLDAEREQRVQFHGTVADEMLERRAVQELHHDESLAVLLPDVINRADIGVVQGGSSLRLALKASQRLGIAGHLVGQELERHEAVEARVFGLVDDAHAAATQLLDYPVMGDRLTDHR